jgi:formylglycine-generating enzyme required for sulfatase activity
MKKRLGAGAFGTVYLAHDKNSRQDVALKVVPVLPGRGEIYRTQLVHEFRLKEKVTDLKYVLRSYLPTVIGHKGADFVLLPMEHAQGGSLREWMVSQRGEEGYEAAALGLFRQACLGVGAIHEAGLVHLDLKPENLLLVRKGKDAWTVKVSDFGLGRDLAALSMMSPELMRDGVGTPGYMSPEQIQAANPREVDKESDIYALGCILCELLIGTVPYTGDNRKVLEIHNSGRPPKLKGLDGQYRAAVFACIETDEANRPASVEDLLALLDGKETERQRREREAEEKRKAAEKAAVEAVARERRKEEARREAERKAAEQAAAEAERRRREAECKAEVKRIAAGKAERERKEQETKERAAARARVTSKEVERCRRGTLEIPGMIFRGENIEGLEEYENEKSGVVLVRIPRGEFRMGNENGTSNEQPVHRVVVSDFMMGKYPVTVGEFRAFCAATRGSMPDAPSWGWDVSNPMVNVCRDDAFAFCQWAGGRLPTEAEWEYAAGGGARWRQKWAGTNEEEELGWFAWNGEELLKGSTHPVGKKRANLLGLNDMSGNVWELCMDWYGDGYYGISPVDNPQGPSEGTLSVGRGGAWNCTAEYMRVTFRYSVYPANRVPNVGFRLVIPLIGWIM